MGSNSTFNDDVHGETSDLFIHKESNFHSDGKTNQIKFIEIKYILQVKESSNIIILPSVFWAFSIETRSYTSLSIAESQ